MFNSMRIETLAMIVVALSGFFWGLYWLPLRGLENAGIHGLWVVLIFHLLPSLMLLPLMLWRFRSIMAGGWALHIAGLLAGSALIFYAGSLVFTDVVRAILLFYLSPIWATILSRVFLGEPITIWRAITIGLGAVGLTIILRLDQGLDVTINLGDAMGLASGIVWAVATVFIKSRNAEGGVDFTLAYFFWGSVVIVVMVMLSPVAAGPAPDGAIIRAALPWMVAVALVLIIPTSFGSIWGATILSPGLLSILFMTEISAGAITAAIWADEPFGTRELIGVIVITCAGLFEPVMTMRSEKKQAQA